MLIDRWYIHLMISLYSETNDVENLVKSCTRYIRTSYVIVHLNESMNEGMEKLSHNTYKLYV